MTTLSSTPIDQLPMYTQARIKAGLKHLATVLPEQVIFSVYGSALPPVPLNDAATKLRDDMYTLNGVSVSTKGDSGIVASTFCAAAKEQLGYNYSSRPDSQRPGNKVYTLTRA